MSETKPDVSSGLKLVVLEGGKEGIPERVRKGETPRVFSLDEKSLWTLGRRTPQNQPDIPLSSEIAGRTHGEFRVQACANRKNWYYEDKGSLNGTFHNGNKLSKPLNNKRAYIPVYDGDILRIDAKNLERPDARGVWMLVSKKSLTGTWSFFPLRADRKTVVGSSADCDLAASLARISERNFQIVPTRGGYMLNAFSDAAPVFLNAKEVKPGVSRPLREKDWISVGDSYFIFTDNGLVYNEMEGDTAREVILRAEIRSKTVPLPLTEALKSGRGERRGFAAPLRDAFDAFRGAKKKVLLRDIRLELYAGELVALLGTAGAGKSTLMNCLNGLEPDGVEGETVFLGENLYRNFERLKDKIGYVPQENVFHGRLTVEEELWNAAELRLGKNASQKNIRERVNRVLELLDMADKKNASISKLSGGEKKRVNIGIDMVGDKRFLCLDEPDAGLDPQNKARMVSILRKCAHEENRSVLAIVHDVKEIDRFDRIILLVKVGGVGRLAFAGTPGEARRRFGAEDLSEIYEIARTRPEEFISETGESE